VLSQQPNANGKEAEMDRTGKKFRCHVEKFRERVESGKLVFADSLSVGAVEAVIDQLHIEFRTRVYTPWITLWLFLFQAMSGGSCADAVSRLISDLASKNKPPCSPETGAYCEARSRLPEEFYQSILQSLGYGALQKTPSEWKFFGRNVKVVDGTTVSMPETEANCEQFPLQDPARAGLSFPLARILVIFSLSVGTVLEAAISPYRGKQTGEYALLRTLRESFEPNEILLGDGGFCSYCHLAELLQIHVDSIVRAEPSHLVNLVVVKKLAKDDVLYRWRKPKGKPDTFNRSEFNALPDEILVRLVTVRFDQPGFRTRQVEVLTTLTDHKRFRASDIATLFRRRWRAELFIRDIKTTLGMDQLRCQTPEMIRKEIYAHLIAYNLVRIHMAEAAQLAKILPEQISFTSSLKTLLQFQTVFEQMTPPTLAIMLATISWRRVGKQPDRFEPRAVKRRQPHAYLTTPRAEARKMLLENHLRLTT
jgi:hypothetical protein